MMIVGGELCVPRAGQWLLLPRLTRKATEKNAAEGCARFPVNCLKGLNLDRDSKARCPVARGCRLVSDVPVVKEMKHKEKNHKEEEEKNNKYLFVPFLCYKEMLWLGMHKQAGSRAGNHQRHTTNASPPTQADNATRAKNGNPPTGPLYKHLPNTPHSHHTAPCATEAPDRDTGARHPPRARQGPAQEGCVPSVVSRCCLHCYTYSHHCVS